MIIENEELRTQLLERYRFLKTTEDLSLKELFIDDLVAVLKRELEENWYFLNITDNYISLPVHISEEDSPGKELNYILGVKITLMEVKKKKLE